MCFTKTVRKPPLTIITMLTMINAIVPSVEPPPSASESRRVSCVHAVGNVQENRTEGKNGDARSAAWDSLFSLLPARPVMGRYSHPGDNRRQQRGTLVIVEEMRCLGQQQFQQLRRWGGVGSSPAMAHDDPGGCGQTQDRDRQGSRDEKWSTHGTDVRQGEHPERRGGAAERSRRQHDGHARTETAPAIRALAARPPPALSSSLKAHPAGSLQPTMIVHVAQRLSNRLATMPTPNVIRRLPKRCSSIWRAIALLARSPCAATLS